MIEPIVINKYGETLVPMPRSRNVTEDKTITYMLHTHCLGATRPIYQISETHSLLECERCNLRIHLPLRDEWTWRELRDHFATVAGENKWLNSTVV